MQVPALQRRRRPAYFLSRLEPGSLGLMVKRGGNEWLDADGPTGTPEDLDKMLARERAQWTALVKAANIQVE